MKSLIILVVFISIIQSCKDKITDLQEASQINEIIYSNETGVSLIREDTLIIKKDSVTFSHARVFTSDNKVVRRKVVFLDSNLLKKFVLESNLVEFWNLNDSYGIDRRGNDGGARFISLISADRVHKNIVIFDGSNDVIQFKKSFLFIDSLIEYYKTIYPLK
jgi:hypothetical protein